MDIEILLPLFALFLFIVGVIAFALPVYIGMVASLYLIAKPEDMLAQSILTWKFHGIRVLHSYQKLFEYWQTYDKSVGFDDFVVPLFLPPLVGALVGIFLLRLIILYCVNRFKV